MEDVVSETIEPTESAPVETPVSAAPEAPAAEPAPVAAEADVTSNDAPSAAGAAGSMPLRPRIPPPGMRVKREADATTPDAERKPRRPRRGAPKGAPGAGDRKRGPRKPRSQEFKGDDNDIVTPKEPTDEDKAKRKERVVAAKDALSRSVDVKGPHVAPARAAIKEYLRNLNDPRQPNDEKFTLLIEAPFHAPPKPRGQGGGGGGGRR